MYPKIKYLKAYYVGIVLSILTLLVIIFIIAAVVLGYEDMVTYCFNHIYFKVMMLVILSASMIMFIYNVRLCTNLSPKYLNILYSWSIFALPIISIILARKQKYIVEDEDDDEDDGEWRCS